MTAPRGADCIMPNALSRLSGVRRSGSSHSVKELGTAPIGSLLMRYAVPAVVAMTASSLYNIVDRVFIGHIGSSGEGALALGGLAITFPIMNLSAAFGAMIGVGGSTLMSVKLGQKDYATAKRVLGNIVVLNIAIGVVLGALGILCINPLLRFFGASAQTMPYARDYMFVILLGNAVTHLYLGMNSVLRSTGHPTTAMISTVATVLLNSVLDPVFIFTFRMGILGAATATVLAQLLALLFVLWVLSRPGEPIRLERGIYGLRKRIVRNILAIGISPCLMQLCGCIVVILINKGLTRHGGDLAIAAYGIINAVTFLFVMITMGICQGMQPIAGYNFGAGQYDRVKSVLWKSVWLATSVMTLSWVVCEFVPEWPVRLFTRDEALTGLCVVGMRIVVLIDPLVGFQIVVGNFFQSIGMARKSIFLSLSRQLIFLVPFLLVFPQLWGTNGVWWSIVGADSATVITSAIMYWQFQKKGEKAWKSDIK